jgi:predicted small secreted protein
LREFGVICGSGSVEVARFDPNNKLRSCMKKFVYTLLLGTALLAFASGCRTAHGFGEDMEKAGDKIQEGTR